MRSLHFSGYALTISAAAAMLAGCGAPLQSPNAASGIGAPSVMMQDILSRASAAWRGRDRTPSWMASRAKTQDLLYITNPGTGAVFAYSYPAGKPTGNLTGFKTPMGDCVDQTGHVWIVDSGYSSIFEYAHAGTKRIATLKNSGAKNILGCSVDPTSGNLAVTELGAETGGAVWIYANAKGTPKKYTAPFLTFPYFCAYDDAGNLFIDGLDGNYAFAFGELSSGSSSLESIALDQNVSFPGGVQWDGTHVAIGDQLAQKHHQSAIYQVTVSGSTGSVVGTTQLSGSCDILQFAVSGSSVIAPDNCLNSAGFYAYPAGGAPTKTLTGFQYPVGAAVSVASH